jgi:hypothetical protein
MVRRPSGAAAPASAAGAALKAGAPPGYAGTITRRSRALTDSRTGMGGLIRHRLRSPRSAHCPASRHERALASAGESRA